MNVKIFQASQTFRATVEACDPENSRQCANDSGCPPKESRLGLKAVKTRGKGEKTIIQCVN
jgi:hypothetical protein